MNNQKSIDEVCKHRQLPPIKKGAQCIVDGDPGRIWGGNTAGNFNVKFDEDGKVYNCHPHWRMTVFNPDGSILYKNED
jgi:hypothetical protein